MVGDHMKGDSVRKAENHRLNEKHGDAIVWEA